MKENNSPNQPTIDFKNELNPPQYAAVTGFDGPHLVIAGAGSGKTRVLVHRVAALIEHGVDPRSILLLTFTRKAAKEMMNRAATILDERCLQISGGTFHSFCNIILRRYAAAIDYPNHFTIVDQGDAEDIVGIFRAKLNPQRRKRFPKKGTILSILSKSINTSRTIKDIILDEYPQFEDEESEITRIGRSYKDYKKEHGVMDFDDLLTNTVVLLKEHPKIRQKLSNFYRYIMVDEYQDTNKIQAHIACLLASEHENLMVVGDDSQSIYSFRGAHFENIIDFPKLFPNSAITKLEQNYRSTQPILDFTNAIIENATKKYTKHLFSEIEGKQRPVVFGSNSLEAEAEFICHKILETREEGIELNRMAVLFRSSYHSNILEGALKRYDIPYEKFGGMKFFELAHIKDVMAILRIAVNPKDTIGWRRILLLFEGVGEVYAGRITDTVLTKGLDQLIKKPLSNRKYAKQLADLYYLMVAITDEKTDPIDHLVAIMQYYEPLLKQNYDDYRKRQPDLESILQIAAKYKKADALLADLALDPPVSQSEMEKLDDDEEKLTISTIHSAKGLEWHSVFVIQLVEGHLPTSRSIESEDGVDEERRLFYVAASRAERNLWLSVPNFYMNGYRGFSEPSRFLTEIRDLNDYVENSIESYGDDDYNDYASVDRFDEYFS